MISKTTLFTAAVSISFSISSLAQWNMNSSINTPVSTSLNDQQDPRIVTDGNKGAIMVWADFRANITLADIYVQRLGIDGKPVWAANGVGLCTDAALQTAPNITEDGSGGAIVAWQDWRNGTGDIYAQKINAAGQVQWTVNGVALAQKNNDQKDAQITNDGKGGAIIVWQDSINNNWDIFAQRINSNGTVMWASGGVSICSSGNAQINPKVTIDSTGGAYIVWQDKRNNSDYDIFAQLIDSTGLIKWKKDGVQICAQPGTQSNPKISVDAQGSAIICWQDKRNNLDYNVYAQKINTTGVVQWASNGVVICNSANSQSAIDMTTEGISDGVVITWKDFRSNNNFDIYAQKIDLSGLVQWTSNGINICNKAFDQINPNIVGDGTGNVIIAWQDSGAGNWDVYSQKLNSGGLTQWSSNGDTTGTALKNQIGPKHVSDGQGGAIFVWQDKRNGLDFDIYAHRLNMFGLGIGTGINNATDDASNVLISPNPSSGDFKIEIKNAEASGIHFWNLKIYDLLGQQVLNTNISNTSTHIVSNNLLVPGIYNYVISTELGAQYQGKIIHTH